MVAEPLLAKVLGEGWTVAGQRFPGRELERWTYQRPFDLVEIPDAHFVVPADYVTTEDGTGLVHQAPAFGADDLRSCRAYGLPVVNPIRPDGTFEDSVPAGRRHVLQGRRRRAGRRPARAGCCSGHEPYEHSYPHCWRCHTRCSTTRCRPGTSAPPRSRTQLLAENEKTNWYPPNDQARPVRRLAAQQHRLGAVPEPLLGHAAADLALRGRAPHLRRLAGRARPS